MSDIHVMTARDGTLDQQAFVARTMAKRPDDWDITPAFRPLCTGVRAKSCLAIAPNGTEYVLYKVAVDEDLTDAAAVTAFRKLGLRHATNDEIGAFNAALDARDAIRLQEARQHQLAYATR